MQEHFITVHGVELFYADEGSGPPCLLLHGGPGLDHSEFVPWLSPLASSARLIYLDYRGNGRSPRISPEQFTTAAVVEDIEALRQLLGFAQVAVLGAFLRWLYRLELRAGLSYCCVTLNYQLLCAKLRNWLRG